MRRVFLIALLTGCLAPSTADAPDRDLTGDSGSPVPEPAPVLVLPGANGVSMLDMADDKLLHHLAWAQVLPDCDRCGSEGASPDGDGLLVAFTNRPHDGIVRIHADGTLDFRVDGFAFPHDVIRDPADGSLLVVESFADRVAWIAGDGSSSEPLRALDTSTEGFVAVPNGAERFEHEGRTYLLLSHLGTRMTEHDASGRITLWDITTPGSPALRWSFPEKGGLAVPHGPILRQVDGTWWLLWAHTLGRNGTGTVGMAATADPLQRPTYVVDLAPGEDVGPFRFLRGVERGPAGNLWLVDSGGAPDAGRLVEAAWPVGLTPTGATGAAGDQVYEDLGLATVRRSKLPSPFEGWLWERPATPTDQNNR